VISPVEKGLLLASARAALCGPAALCGLVVRARNAFYDLGLKESRRAPVPVISVGNVTAGGTGKTPMVAMLAWLLQVHGMRPAILSRGYGGRHGRCVDDENEMLARICGTAAIVVNPDRLQGADTAVRQCGANVLILDDGFQHRRIARDLDIVLIDATCPFGAGRMIPRGLLREPLAGLKRASLLVITRVDLAGKERVAAVRERLARLAPGVPVACCAMAVSGARPAGDPEATPLPPEALREGRWAAFCGIGNPEGFRLALERAGCDVADFTVFADHEAYTAGQLAQLRRRAAGLACRGILTTEKDAMKVEQIDSPGAMPPIYALLVEMGFTEGTDELARAVLSAAGAQPRSSG